METLENNYRAYLKNDTMICPICSSPNISQNNDIYICNDCNEEWQKENNIKNKTVFITGSTDGIGKQTAIDLIHMGAHIIIHGRDENKVHKVIKELKNLNKTSLIDYYIADFSSLAEVIKLSEHIHKDYKKIDILINNAGVYLATYQKSRDGYEMTFAICHLAHFLLTLSLLDLILCARKGRIITVSSLSNAGILDLEALTNKEEYSAMWAYAQAKLCNTLFSFELAERLNSTPITVTCLDPGNVDTKLWEGDFMDAVPVDIGSRTSIFCATTMGSLLHGKFISECRETSPQKLLMTVYQEKNSGL